MGSVLQFLDAAAGRPGPRVRWPGVVAALALVAVTAGCRHDHDDADAESGFVVVLQAPAGSAASEATTISGDGLVVAGTATSTTGMRRAFRWTAREGATPLGLLPGGTSASAAAASADGSVIVGSGDGGGVPGVRAVRWGAGGEAAPLEPLRASTLCVAAAVSGDGAVVAGTCLVTGNEAIRWADAGPAVGLGRLGTGSNASSTANAISRDGRVIGGSGHPVLSGAALWTADGVPTIIGSLPGDSQGYVAALDDSGTVAVGSSVDAAGHPHAFRWTAGSGIVALGTRAEFVATRAVAVSGNGQRAVGWATTASGADVAVTWDDGGRLRTLVERLSPASRADAARVSLAHARAVSASGLAIAGHGPDASGNDQAWVVFLRD